MASKNKSFADLFAATQSKVPKLRRSQEVSGKIVSVSPNEILVDIGAKSEGVLTGRELSAASDIVSRLSIGDTIEATVLYPENDAGQVVLSLHKLSQDARWKELEDNKENDEDFEVVAMEVNRGGVICDFKGIRGFLPASQLAPTPSGAGLVKAPAKLAELIGKKLKVRVIEVDRTSNRLILSQKRLDKKDLSETLKLLSKVEIGQTLSGVVSAVLPFGIFVEVEVEEKGTKGTKSTGRMKGEGAKLEGLVHISEISWEKVEEPGKYFKVGDKVEVLVIDKDELSGRLNFSVKQLAEDPFVKASQKYSKDIEVKGRVDRVTGYGVFVSLEDVVEGLIHISKIPPNKSFEVGQIVECSVESIDMKSRRISLVPIVREKPVLYR